MRAAPVLTAISLILSPAALSRRTSRIFLMVSLFLGTWSLLSYTGVTSEEGHVPSWVDQGATHPRRGLEVSAFSRNLVRITPERCPLCAGTGVRFPPDYAVGSCENVVPDDAAQVTIGHLVGAAINRHGTRSVLRALTRAERASDDVFPIL